MNEQKKKTFELHSRTQSTTPSNTQLSPGKISIRRKNKYSISFYAFYFSRAIQIYGRFHLKLRYHNAIDIRKAITQRFSLEWVRYYCYYFSHLYMCHRLKCASICDFIFCFAFLYASWLRVQQRCVVAKTMCETFNSTW